MYQQSTWWEMEKSTVLQTKEWGPMSRIISKPPLGSLQGFPADHLASGTSLIHPAHQHKVKFWEHSFLASLCKVLPSLHPRLLVQCWKLATHRTTSLYDLTFFIPKLPLQQAQCSHSVRRSDWVQGGPSGALPTFSPPPASHSSSRSQDKAC